MSIYDINEARQVEIFRALGDSTRLKILKLLSSGELCVCQIEQALKISQTLTSRHLSVLRMIGLVRTRKEGQWVYYSYNQPRTLFEQQVLACIKSSLPELPVGQRKTDDCNQPNLAEEKRSPTIADNRRRKHAAQG
jgi:ArsR family transcriptional regulator